MTKPKRASCCAVAQRQLSHYVLAQKGHGSIKVSDGFLGLREQRLEQADVANADIDRGWERGNRPLDPSTEPPRATSLHWVGSFTWFMWAYGHVTGTGQSDVL
mmetsp:Transcript_65321/g.143211  ORF Transcript_65321/g.143211 Transcript_65321/m.143211 type:complete len:103 (+) Transcript_65321:144-452(+)